MDPCCRNSASAMRLSHRWRLSWATLSAWAALLEVMTDKATMKFPPACRQITSRRTGCKLIVGQWILAFTADGGVAIQVRRDSRAVACNGKASPIAVAITAHPTEGPRSSLLHPSVIRPASRTSTRLVFAAAPAGEFVGRHCSANPNWSCPRRERRNPP